MSVEDLASPNPPLVDARLVPRARIFQAPENGELAALYAGLSANELCFFAEVAWFTNDDNYYRAAVEAFDALVFHARELLDDPAADRVKQLASEWQGRFESVDRADEIVATRIALAEDLERSDRSDAEVFESHCRDLSLSGTHECLVVHGLIKQGIVDTLGELFEIGACLGEVTHSQPAYRRLTVRRPAAESPSTGTSPTWGEFLVRTGAIRRGAAPTTALPSLPLHPPTTAEHETWKRELGQRCRIAGLQLGTEQTEQSRFIASLRADPESIEQFLARARLHLIAPEAVVATPDDAGYLPAPGNYLDIEYCEARRAVRRRDLPPVTLPGGKVWEILMRLLDAGNQGRTSDQLFDEFWADEPMDDRSCLHSDISTLRKRLRPIQLSISRPRSAYRLILADDASN